MVDNTSAAPTTSTTARTTAPIADEVLINQAYYHGFTTREEAEALIPKKDGAFLVRLVQEDNEFIYIISVYWKDKVHHLRIWRTEHQHYYYLHDVPKRSVRSLVLFHRLSQWPVNPHCDARLRSIVKRSHYALYREQIEMEKGVIGHGEFGEVHKGHLRLGIFTVVDVAIKLDLLRIDANERIKFLHEANLMMRLRHRNVVRLHGVVIYNDPILIVTEYAPGGSLLAALMRFDEAPTPAERTCFCRDMCFGMAYLERQSVIHRDLSAKNCLLGRDGTLKIADFGLSIKGSASIEITKGNAPIRYVPPETLMSAIFSHKTDVWAFGVTLFEIWQYPYEEPYAEIEQNRELKRRILEGLRLGPPANMPAEIRKLMARCFAAEPDERPTFEQIRDTYFGKEPTRWWEAVGRITRTIFDILAF